MTDVIAADWSRYSTGNVPPSPALYTTMKSQNNVGLVIPGAWHGNEGYDGVQDSLSRGRDAGMLTGTYIAVTPGSGVEGVDRAYQMIGHQEWSKLIFASIDAEIAPMSAETVWAAMVEVAERGVYPVLYSRPGFLHEMTPPDPQLPPGMAIWSANADPWPDGTVVGVQGQQTALQDATTNQTITVDLSTFNGDWIASRAHPDPTGDLVALVAAWKSDMGRIAEGVASLINRPLDVTALALYALYVGQRTEAWKRIVPGGK